VSCGGNGLFRQYEYEEEMYLSLDGSATVYVNSSVPALVALRGAPFDSQNAAQVDREAVRGYFTTPVTRVTRRPGLSRRSGRRFVHVRLDVDDVTKLASAAPFAWSSYLFTSEGKLRVYRQAVGAAAGRTVGDVGWSGSELVAFRVHLPSKIVAHNAGPANHKRGNILVWEQPLSARLRGEPVEMDARFESESILYRTLFLFGTTFLVVALSFAAAIWWFVRHGVQPGPGPADAAR
jgi:hypothetical protein